MQPRNLARPAAVLGIFITVIGLAWAGSHFLGSLTGSAPLQERELATRRLGEYLASRFPGKGAVVLSNPFSDMPGQPREVYQFERAGLRGLKRGFGTSIQIRKIILAELKPGLLENPGAAYIDPHSTTPLSYLMADDVLDKVVEENPRAEIVVSLIGLPVNVRRSRAWNVKGPPMIALLLPDLRAIGDETEVRRAFHGGKLAAVILKRPGVSPEDRSPQSDPRKEFDRRFLLVTTENFDSCLRIYPRLF